MYTHMHIHILSLYMGQLVVIGSLGLQIIAGDSVVLRPQICDELGNPAALPEGALDVHIIFPDGASQDLHSPSLKFFTQTKGGVTTYDIRHEATHAGEHEVHIMLHGTPIKGSPVIFNIETAAAEVKMCKLTPPSDHTLYSNKTYTILLKTYDRFGNPMTTGGLPVSGRLQLIKQGVHDLTTLMPNNNTVEIADNDNGTYDVNVTLIKIAATVKAIVNMDKNIPAAGGELPPVQLTFMAEEGPSNAATVMAETSEPAPAPVEEERSSSPSSSKAKEKFRNAALDVIHMMGGTLDTEHIRPKAAIAVAADAFEAAGKAAAKKPKA